MKLESAFRSEPYGLRLGVVLEAVAFGDGFRSLGIVFLLGAWTWQLHLVDRP